MTKTRNTLLNTQLHSPVTFLGAPRNTIPNQEIPPLPTSRVTTGSQRVSLSATPVKKAPLHTTQGQTLTKQPLQRVSLQKQSVGVQALSAVQADDKPSDDTLPSNLSSLVALSATPLPTSKLKPLKNTTAPSRVSRETAARSKQNDTVCPQTVGFTAQALSTMHSGSLSIAMPNVKRRFHAQERDEVHPVSHEKPVAHIESPKGATPMPLVAERRFPLMGQRIELHPVFAKQRPVARRKSRLKRK